MPKSSASSKGGTTAAISAVAPEKKEKVSTQETTEANAPRYTAPALGKGLDILELLTEVETGLTLNQIAKKLERSVNEIFRMVVTLEQRGYLVADDGDRYRLTLKLFELSHRHHPIKSLVSTALPHMRELSNRAMQSCHLTVYSAGRLIVVAQVDSSERWAFGLKVGALVGLMDTASGYILLSFRDEAERGRMLAAHIKTEGEMDVDTGQLLREIQETKERGFSMMQSKQIRGVTNISYPIFGAGNQAVAALNVPYIERIDKKVNPNLEEVKAIVGEIAGRISAMMGFSDASFSA